MTIDRTPALVVADALDEARRRGQLSDRDLSGDVAHFAAHLGPVCEAWGLTPRGWFDGGAGMPTVDVVRADGSAAVLKVAAPPGLEAAAGVMAAASGHGYAAVLAWDPSVGALLTERLGGDLWSEHPGLCQQAAVVAPLLRDAWQVPLGSGKPLARKASGLVAILDELGPRYGESHEDALRLARSYAQDLASTEQPEVVCHGDPHAGNVLRRGPGWALIDPDGFVGERAYDLGVVVRDACREYRAAEDEHQVGGVGSGADLLRDACTFLAEVTGTDAERIWRWGYVERVTTGLYLAWHGYPDEATTFLDTAGGIAAQV